jgi:selenocysteine-specific elongation factor
MFVLGTAGHIDHGKSLLVKAMTGIDPDRLREEKERGMTIELGFAWVTLPSGREVGIVDVPGHERFVKNMLAGVGGIDLALLIVAANEGVMPQTREHLAILDLLGVERGIAVITKKDLVDEEMVTLVRMEVEEVLASTALAGAPVLAVSAMTGEGLSELLAAIDRMLEQTEPKRDLGRPRLPVDRVFTMSGAGTVVTGTLIDGTLSVGQEVEVLPVGLKSRVRGLQTHKSKLTTAAPGSRVAANLVGLSTEQLTRGDVVTRPGWLKSTRLVTARLTMIDYLTRPVRHGSSVSFHTGAAEVMGKLRLLEADTLKPGEATWVQVALTDPVAVVKGDRYIIRSPMETLGGGSIVDAHARRLRRFRADVIENLKARESGSAGQAVLAALEARQPQERATLVAQSSLSAGAVGEAVAGLVESGDIIALGETGKELLFTAAGWAALAGTVRNALADYHRKYPARPGMPKLELAGKLKLGNRGAPALARLAAEGVAVEEGTVMRLAAHVVTLTAAQQKALDAFEKDLAAHPYAPSSELAPEPDLVALLLGQGKVVRVSENVIFSRAAYDDMLARITARIRDNGKVSLGEVRDLFGTSRKYAQALLEYLDREKITKRVGDDRVLY